MEERSKKKEVGKKFENFKKSKVNQRKHSYSKSVLIYLISFEKKKKIRKLGLYNRLVFNNFFFFTLEVNVPGQRDQLLAFDSNLFSNTNPLFFFFFINLNTEIWNVENYLKFFKGILYFLPKLIFWTSERKKKKPKILKVIAFKLFKEFHFFLPFFTSPPPPPHIFPFFPSPNCQDEIYWELMG